MDIGPTELPIQPLLPNEGIRRVEGLSDARQYPQRQQKRDDQADEGEPETPQDSVDVSATYRMAHAEQLDPAGESAAQEEDSPADLTAEPPRLDIVA